MYVKPQLQRFGSLRELTLIGLDANCDGGVQLGPVSGVADGSWLHCNRS